METKERRSSSPSSTGAVGLLTHCLDDFKNWPAAAVIPAPIAYINAVAVKKLVVGFWGSPFSGIHLEAGPV